LIIRSLLQVGTHLRAAQSAVLSLRNLLEDITAWGWERAPPQQLVFTADVPKLDQPLPRALAPDIDAAVGLRAPDYGVITVTPHQLCHTWATELAYAGRSLQVLMALLGHTTDDTALCHPRLRTTNVAAFATQPNVAPAFRDRGAAGRRPGGRVVLATRAICSVGWSLPT